MQWITLVVTFCTMTEKYTCSLFLIAFDLRVPPQKRNLVRDFLFVSKKEAVRAHRIVRGVSEQLQQQQPKKRCKRASLLFELCQKYAVKSFHTDSAAVLTKNHKFLSSPRSSAEKERKGETWRDNFSNFTAH